MDSKETRYSVKEVAIVTGNYKNLKNYKKIFHAILYAKIIISMFSAYEPQAIRSFAFFIKILIQNLPTLIGRLASFLSVLSRNRND